MCKEGEDQCKAKQTPSSPGTLLNTGCLDGFFEMWNLSVYSVFSAFSIGFSLSGKAEPQGSSGWREQETGR